MSNLLDLLDESLETEIQTATNTIDFFINAFPGNFYWYDKNGLILGCNDNQAISLGLKTSKDLIGLNAYDIWDQCKDIAIVNALKENNNYIMESGDTATFEETGIHLGQKRIFLSKKAPLRNGKNEIIGIIGISVDITSEKEAQNLKIKEHEKVRKNLYKFIHDMQSPITSIMSMAGTFKLPESERIALRNTARRASDLCHHLLMQYNEELDDIAVFEIPEPVLASCTLAEILTEKRYQYRERLVFFEDAFEEHFAFILAEPNAFRRMMSNIINNAVDAFDEKHGTVTIILKTTAEWVTIIVSDNGKGMKPETIQKIMNNTGFTEDKKNGHGIGYSQILQTLQDNHGKINIESKPGEGTRVILTFPREDVPFWSANAVDLEGQDIVVVLDDEPSVTIAWQSHFVIALRDHPDIKIKYFNAGREALDFIQHLPVAEHDKVVLITDYELIGQELNGLDVVEKSGVKRSILATSHYADKAIRTLAIKTGTKILPKQLIPEVSINVTTKPAEMEKADLVIIDDNESFAKIIMLTVFNDLNVKYYASSAHFLKESEKYPKNIKICIDKNFAGDMDGVILAEALHQKGFNRIFLISGEYIAPNVLPGYITVIHKADIGNIKDY